MILTTMNLPDGTILLWRWDDEQPRSIARFVCRAIVYFTNSPYIHAAVVSHGRVYESTVWKENGKTLHGTRESGMERAESADKTLVPVTPLTEMEGMDLRVYCAYTEKMKRPYNFLKFLALMAIYPTRRFWSWIGWVPFNREVQGNVCSEYVGDAWTFFGKDLLPGEHDGHLVPGDIPRSLLVKDL